MIEFLDNIIWNSLSGAQACFSCGVADARRYSPGFSPIIGFANTDHPNFEGLAPYCGAGEQFYCANWSGAVPRGWNIDAETTMFKMVWDAPAPHADGLVTPVDLGSEHALPALELANLTRPGPFGPRTIELGDYVGVFEDDRLVAMAGERMHAQLWREISGVCTHPDFQGRGFGRRLIVALIRRQLRRGERPFLHVMHDNSSAHSLYQRMGFRDYREVLVRIVSRL